MVFAAVAQKKSFTGAAKYLHVSKSSISQQISQLENQLGAALLNRTTREVSLTPLGTKLLERCTVLQDQLSLLFNDLDEAGVNPSGRFAVTFPHSLQSHVITPAIKQLLSEYPNLEPKLIADDKPLDLVEHHLDVAIHIGELPDSGYRALPVGSLSELFCASPRFLIKHKPILSAQDLTSQKWISTSWQRAKTTVTHLKLEKKEIIHLKEYAKCNTLTGAIDLALKDLGIVLVPDVVAKPLIQTGELVHIATDIQGPEWPVYTVHAYQQEKPIHISRFHQIICRSFKSL